MANKAWRVVALAVASKAWQCSVANKAWRVVGLAVASKAWQCSVANKAWRVVALAVAIKACLAVFSGKQGLASSGPGSGNQGIAVDLLI